MFSSFKNTELFRYFIRVDINKGIDKIIRENKSSFSLIAGSIFSGSFSILGTYFGMHDKVYNSICIVVRSSVLFCILFVIGMTLFKVCAYIFGGIYNAWKKEKLPSAEKIKGYIDDFDHIACDNILISQNFIMAYKDPDTSADLKEFYFYEIIYYTKVSLGIIQKIFVNSNRCINDKNSTNKIYLFRLENSLKMLNEIYCFLNKNKMETNCDKRMQYSLDNEIESLKKAIDKFQLNCEELKVQIYK